MQVFYDLKLEGSLNDEGSGWAELLLKEASNDNVVYTLQCQLHARPDDYGMLTQGHHALHDAVKPGSAQQRTQTDICSWCLGAALKCSEYRHDWITGMNGLASSICMSAFQTLLGSIMQWLHTGAT